MSERRGPVGRRHEGRVDGRRAVWWSAGEGPVVLFLHGWALSPASYRTGLAQVAARGARVVAPALPGFGGSDELPAAEFTLAGYARWVVRFLESVGVEGPVTVVGHSFGGGVAVRLAHDASDVVSRLVLVNSIGGAVWATGPAGPRLMSERPWWDWGLHLQADLDPGGPFGRVVPVIVSDAATNALRNPLAVWRVAELARTADLRHELEELRRRRLPVVVVWGRQDRVLPEASLAALRLALGDDVVRTVEGTHSWLITDPDAFTEILTNVLTERPLRPLVEGTPPEDELPEPDAPAS
ncbi:alpha/beta fold hydrolase [Actinomycetospora cinnamomea]|uniref:Pimeloyl-ACP methyl ester carboxylesterase n=1 Tax=Actinomycetospora cinnamomea TaxID=663609 RepID=A0A2U1F2C5_9PSEU|nr:alpha/beta hydrolase [Actinomycetospora cinnamomea]PVZ06318.1 pimeloyl-ACP methyl ester carboxylesterase [Actinomycetospora cinnamomea]